MRSVIIQEPHDGKKWLFNSFAKEVITRLIGLLIHTSTLMFRTGRVTLLLSAATLSHQNRQATRGPQPSQNTSCSTRI